MVRGGGVALLALAAVAAGAPTGLFDAAGAGAGAFAGAGRRASRDNAGESASGAALLRDPKRHKCIQDDIVAEMGDEPLPRAVRGSRETAAEARRQSRAYTVRFEFIEDDDLRCLPGVSSVTVDRIYTCNSMGDHENLWTQEKRDFFEDILDDVASWFFQTMRVTTVVDNFKASNDDLRCSRSRGDFLAPAQYQFSGAGSALGDDMVMFVTMRPSDEFNLAYASTCLQADLDGRPVLGHININTEVTMEELNANPRKYFATIIHEVTHAALFNTLLFPMMPGSAGLNDAGDIVGDTIVDFLSDHFGCNTIESAIMELDGGPGTAGTHFEEQIFGDELMTGSVGEDAVISGLTLGLYADSGWYTVNDDTAERFLWGKDQGCGFLEDCTQWSTTIPDGDAYECTAGSSELKCSFDYGGFGPCVPLQDGSLNVCPTIGVGHDCGNPSDMDGISDAQLEATAHENCPSCSCFQSSVKSGSQVRPFGDMSCHRYACEAKNAIRVLLGDLWYRCFNDNVLTSDFFLGFNGELVCPSRQSDLLCGWMTGAQSEEESAKWPSFSSIEPTEGDSEGGDTVTITGANLNGVTVTIGTAPLTITERGENGTYIIGTTTKVQGSGEPPGHVILTAPSSSDLPKARTGHRLNAFTLNYPTLDELAGEALDSGLNAASDGIDKVNSFLEQYWWGPAAGLFVMLVLGAYCIWKCCIKSSAPKTKKGKRRVAPRK